MSKIRPKLFLIFSVFLLLVGSYSTNYALLTSTLFILVFQYCNIKRVYINYIDINFFIFLLVGYLNYFFSINGHNTFLNVITITYLCILYISLKITFRSQINKQTFFLVITFFILFVIILGYLLYIKFNVYLAFTGLTNFYHFRYQFKPFNLILNDWVGVLIIFLPICSITLLYNRRNKYLNLLFSLLLGLIFSMIILTYSRAGLYSIILFITVFCFLFILKRQYLTANLRPFLIALLIPVLSILVNFDDFINVLLLFKTKSQQLSYQGRLFIWERILVVLKDNFVFGVGSNNYALKTYFSPLFNTISTTRATNSFLQLFLENGILGLLSFCLILFALLKTSYITLFKGKTFKIIGIIFISSILMISFREMFFSSLFRNNVMLIGFTTLTAFLSSFRYSNIKLISLEAIQQKFIAVKWVIFIFILTIAFFNVRNLLSEYNNNVAIKEYSNKNYDKCIKHLDKAIHLNTTNAVYYNNLSLLYERKANKGRLITDIIDNLPNQQNLLLDRAQNNLEQALRINPNDDLFIHNLGWIFFMKNELFNAKKCFYNAIKRNSAVAHYYISLGLLYERIEKSDSAKINYSTALINSPDLLDSKFVSDLEKRGSVEELVYMSINTLSKNSKNDPVLESKLGKLYLYIDTTKAEELFQKSIKNLPYLNRSYMYLGIIYEKKHKDLSSAKDFYEMAFNIDRTDLRALNNLCEFYRTTNNKFNYGYYKNKLFEIKNKSTHSYFNEAIYHTKGINDELLPSGYLEYLYY